MEYKNLNTINKLESFFKIHKIRYLVFNFTLVCSLAYALFYETFIPPLILLCIIVLPYLAFSMIFKLPLFSIVHSKRYAAYVLMNVDKTVAFYYIEKYYQETIAKSKPLGKENIKIIEHLRLRIRTTKDISFLEDIKVSSFYLINQDIRDDVNKTLDILNKS